jgi:hypothetical protein
MRFRACCFVPMSVRQWRLASLAPWGPSGRWMRRLVGGGPRVPGVSRARWASSFALWRRCGVLAARLEARSRASAIRHHLWPLCVWHPSRSQAPTRRGAPLAPTYKPPAPPPSPISPASSDRCATAPSALDYSSSRTHNGIPDATVPASVPASA